MLYSVFFCRCGKSILRNFSRCIGSSSLLFHDGSTLQALQLITRHVHVNSLLTNKKFSDKWPRICNRGCEEKGNELISEICLLPDIGNIVNHLNKCSCLNEVLCVVDNSTANSVCPIFALHILNKFISLKNNYVSVNALNGNYHLPPSDVHKMYINKLTEVIISSDSSTIIFEAFLILSKELTKEQSAYRSNIVKEVLCRLQGGHYSLSLMCKVVTCLKNFDSNIVDKTGIGFVIKEHELNNSSEFIQVCQVLHYFTNFRPVILSLLERSAMKIWWTFKISDITEIISYLCFHRIHSKKILDLIVFWMKSNSTFLSDYELMTIINSLTSISYFDDQLVHVFVTFFESKSPQIKNDSECLGLIMDYCVKSRIRCSKLLDRAAEAIILNGIYMTSSTLTNIFKSLGLFCYEPKNSQHFWQSFETLFQGDLSNFYFDDVIEIILCCLYLEKHPIKLVNRIFNAQFLYRALNSHTSDAESARNKLKIIDSIMAIECSYYDGPRLPKCFKSKYLSQDIRIKQIINSLRHIFTDIAEGPDLVSYSVVSPYLCDECYVIDAMLHPSKQKMVVHGDKTNYKFYTAIIIMLPEHFCNQEHFITGPQKMKLRYLKKLGYQIVTLNYKRVSELRTQHILLKDYVISCFKGIK